MVIVKQNVIAPRDGRTQAKKGNAGRRRDKMRAWKEETARGHDFRDPAGARSR